MPNKYCFGLTRAEKLRILAKKILYKFDENGTSVTLENFADYCELLSSTYGAESTQAVYNLLAEMNA